MVTVYSKKHCPQCGATYRQLDRWGIEYIIIDVEDEPAAFDQLATAGHLALPVVIAGDATWAGFRPDLIAHYAKTLDAMRVLTPA